MTDFDWSNAPEGERIIWNSYGYRLPRVLVETKSGTWEGHGPKNSNPSEWVKKAAGFDTRQELLDFYSDDCVVTFVKPEPDKPKKGDRVRIVFEGELIGQTSLCTTISVDKGLDSQFFWTKSISSLEVIEKAKPKWPFAVGDLVKASFLPEAVYIVVGEFKLRVVRRRLNEPAEDVRNSFTVSTSEAQHYTKIDI